MKNSISIILMLTLFACENSLLTEYEASPYDSVAMGKAPFNDTISGLDPINNSDDQDYINYVEDQPSMDKEQDDLIEEESDYSVRPFFETGFEDARFSSDYKRYLGPTWEDFESNPIIESVRTLTEGYNTTAAYPEIVNFQGDNKLHFVIKSKSGKKARVQSTFAFNVDTIREYKSQFEFYLHPDMAYLSNSPSRLEWFSFFEIWEQKNPAWDGNNAGQAYWFLCFMKDAGVGNKLYWRMEGDYMQPAAVMDDAIWPPQVNRSVPVPFGKWAKLTHTFTIGEGSEGHILITLEIDGTEYTLFDIHNSTTYPGHHRKVAWYQPFKFYMPAAWIDYLNANDKKCEVWYDNYKLYLK